MRRARDNLVFLLLAAALFLGAVQQIRPLFWLIYSYSWRLFWTAEQAYYIYAEAAAVFCQNGDQGGLGAKSCTFMGQIIYTSVLLGKLSPRPLSPAQT